MICKHDGYCCDCFYRVSFGMNPNSGVYKIKIKINKINNELSTNVIGITCNDIKQIIHKNGILGIVHEITLVGHHGIIKVKMIKMYQMV